MYALRQDVARLMRVDTLQARHVVRLFVDAGFIAPEQEAEAVMFLKLEGTWDLPSRRGRP
jgi:hypothetical protein